MTTVRPAIIRIGERSFGEPLLEIYNPVLQPWSGQVVAVSEFYEVADGLEQSLEGARLKSWQAAAGFTIVFLLLLSAIVFRGSRVVERNGLHFDSALPSYLICWHKMKGCTVTYNALHCGPPH